MKSAAPSRTRLLAGILTLIMLAMVARAVLYLHGEGDEVCEFYQHHIDRVARGARPCAETVRRLGASPREAVRTEYRYGADGQLTHIIVGRRPGHHESGHALSCTAVGRTLMPLVAHRVWLTLSVLDALSAQQKREVSGTPHRAGHKGHPNVIKTHAYDHRHRLRTTITRNLTFPELSSVTTYSYHCP